MKFPALYRKLLNGQIQVWSIEVDGHTITTTFGQVNEKMQTVKTEINKGKNKSSHDRLVAALDACLKAHEKYDKKVSEGYLESKADAEAIKMSRILRVFGLGEKNGPKQV